MTDRYLDDLMVGESWEGAPFTITEAEVIAFAQQFDPQPMHIDKAAAEAGVAASQAALRYQVLVNFNELLLAQQRVDFATQTHALASQALDAANKRVQAGKVPPLELAKAQRAPAYTIFADLSLIDMAERMPRTRDEFAEVHGVGEAKLAKYAEGFLAVIAKNAP